MQSKKNYSLRRRLKIVFEISSPLLHKINAAPPTQGYFPAFPYAPPVSGSRSFEKERQAYVLFFISTYPAIEWLDAFLSPSESSSNGNSCLC